MTTTPPSAGVLRYPALDGLRGVAALVVLLHHVAFVVPAFATTYFTQELPPTGSLLWWFSYTPLKLLTAGPEAVVVFFLLSGFVLALEPLNRSGFDWVAYYPRRIARLYVPIVASVVLAVALLLLVPRDPSAVTGAWSAVLADPRVSIGTVARESTVLFGAEFLINPPLWSLVWEVWFSLLLPLFVAVVVLVRRAWWAAALVGFGMSLVGMRLHLPALGYLPMFLIGVALASGAGDLRAVAARIQGWRFGTMAWAALTALGALLLVFTWMVRGTAAIDVVAAATVSGFTVVGATLLVVCCAFSPAAGRVLTTRPATWLGRISYSLYLVHVPVLLAITFAIGDAQWWWIVVAAIPASLLVAWGFARVVEMPAHRFARWLGRRTAQARAAILPSPVE